MQNLVLSARAARTRARRITTTPVGRFVIILPLLPTITALDEQSINFYKILWKLKAISQ